MKEHQPSIFICLRGGGKATDISEHDKKLIEKFLEDAKRRCMEDKENETKTG